MNLICRYHRCGNKGQAWLIQYIVDEGIANVNLPLAIIGYGDSQEYCWIIKKRNKKPFQ